MPERLWVLNDVSPTSVAMDFEPPPPPWTDMWYGGPSTMHFGVEIPPGPTFGLASHKRMTQPGFFGPRQ
jgi:hypothetical protein